MPMTITEKILAAHAGREAVTPGEFIEARVDLCLANDVTAPLAIREFEALGAARVFDPDRVVLIPDHFVPAKDIRSAEQAKIMREFARRHGIRHYYEVGRCGIEHAFLPEQGLVKPGDLVIGADSHTCTYGALGAFATGVGSTDAAAALALGMVWLRVPRSLRVVFSGTLPPDVGGKDLILLTLGEIGVSGARYAALEFCGETVDALPVEDRLAMCNMAIEAGAKNGIIAPDDLTAEYVRQHGGTSDSAVFHSDPDAEYARVLEFDVSALSPLVAAPPSPANVRPAEELSDVTLDQVVIGSCTNGRLSDLRRAAEVLRGRTVARDVRLIVIPATQRVYLQALAEGLLEVFVEAGAAVSTPTCGPCLGGYMGVLAAGERCLATTNRNFVGRMGDLQSEVYLCNPAVAAASAVTGRITSPRELEN